MVLFREENRHVSLRDMLSFGWQVIHILTTILHIHTTILHYHSS